MFRVSGIGDLGCLGSFACFGCLCVWGIERFGAVLGLFRVFMVLFYGVSWLGFRVERLGRVWEFQGFRVERFRGLGGFGRALGG